MSARLTAIETAYVALEARGSPIHVGSVATFEAAPLLDRHGALRLGELRSRIASRLDALPRMRQRVKPVPLGFGRPVWVDDPEFDIARHVRSVELPAPGDERTLARLAADLHMRPFDQRHPLWDLTFVTGLTGGRVALIERVHHAMADGESGVDVATVILDVDRNAPAEAPEPFVASPPPSPPELICDAVADQARAVRDVVTDAVTPLVNPRRLAGRIGNTVNAVRGLVGDGLIAPRTSLNRPAGRGRTLVFLRQDLDAVKSAGRAVGATVNDVVLSAVAGGLRSLFLARGELLPHDRRVTVMVPVSMRDDGERQTLGNQVGMFLLPVPVGIGHPWSRLAAVAAATAKMKAEGHVVTSEVLQVAADLLPAPLVPPLSGLITRQPFTNLVVTNVQGPSFPLYAMGAKMLEAFPIVPLAGNLTLGVAVLSYNGALNLGVTADSEACPDVDEFVSGVERSFAQLGLERSAAPRLAG